MRVRALCQEILRQNAGALEIENLVQKIQLQTNSLVHYSVKTQHL